MECFITTYTGAHSEKGLYYDRNGNLTALKRYGSTALDDDFTYTYNGNRINTLTDGTTSCAYAYDANGNTKRDGLHNLDIDYNFLNLPWKVQQSKTMKARYSYYADGTKFSVSDATGSSRIYAGNLVYVKRNGVQGLESAAFGGGRFRTSLVIGGVAYIPDYFITDHLGSTRAIIESGETVAQYNYYPYGGEWSTATQLVSDDNRYKFSGKEDQATFGAPIYDFHARSYTSRVPMFLQQDPMISNYMVSPYIYCSGNPVNRIDPTGNIDWPLKGTQAVNKRDYTNGAWGMKNTVVRTSLYLEERQFGTSPHIGIDYRANVGTDVYNLGEGTVDKIGSTHSGINYITIKYKNGDKLRFMHMNSIAEGLKPGDTVLEGEILGESGNSGTYKGKNGERIPYQPHLHVDAIDKFGNSISPEQNKYGTVDNKTFFEEYDGDYRKLKESQENQILRERQIQDAIDQLNKAGLGL